MKMIIHVECIGEIATFMPFYVVIPDIPSLIKPVLTDTKKTIGDIPVASKNDKLISKFHSGTL